METLSRELAHSVLIRKIGVECVSNTEHLLDERIFAMAVRPTVLQRIFSSKWPLRFWFLATATFVAVIALRESGFSKETLSDWRTWLWSALIIILAAALGAIGGLFPGMIIIWPILAARGRANGAPFSEGDVVQILTGPHRGAVSKVYSKWQGESVRVELGSEAAESYKDVFGPTEILRIETVQSETRESKC